MRDGEQLSLFAVISAVATDLHETGGDSLSEPEPHLADVGGAHDDTLVIDLPLLAGPGGSTPVAGGGPVLTRREHKARLRDANAAMARALARKTGWPHAKVNAELNRLAGVRRVTEATVEQLQRRLRQAEHWHGRA